MILFCAFLFALFGFDFWQASGGAATSSGISAMAVQGLIAAVVSGLINLMKNSNWRVFAWITAATPKVAKALSGAAALLVALGITYNHTEAGTTIFIPTLTVALVANSFGTFVVQWIFQHGSYAAIWRSVLPAKP